MKCTVQERVEALVEEHGGLRKAARAVNIAPPYLLRLRDGEHPNVTDRTLAKLGLRRVVSYETCAPVCTVAQWQRRPAQPTKES